jgi:hypothetical protein
MSGAQPARRQWWSAAAAVQGDNNSDLQHPHVT